jgi:hypothetical protein
MAMLPETAQQFDRFAWFLLILTGLPLAGYLLYLTRPYFHERKKR